MHAADEEAAAAFPHRTSISAFYALDSEWLGFTSDTTGRSNNLTQHSLLVQDRGTHEDTSNTYLLELEQSLVDMFVCRYGHRKVPIT